jgi:hypothetical protein
MRRVRFDSMPRAKCAESREAIREEIRLKIERDGKGRIG